MLRLDGGDEVDLGHGLHVRGGEVLDVLYRVHAVARAAVGAARLREDVDRGADGPVAYGVDARGDAAARGLHHVGAHDLGIDGGTAAVAREVRVRVRLVQPRRVRARYAVEELLRARDLHHLAPELCLQALDALERADVLRVQVHAHGDLPRAQKLAVDVVVHEVRARDGAERHVAHARDALREAHLEVVAVRVEHALPGQAREHLRDVVHAGGLVDDAGEVAVRVAVEEAAGRGHGVVRDAELREAARVHPQRVEVALVHADRPVRERLVERGARRRHGRVPERGAKALAQKPPVAGVPRRELPQPADAVLLACARVREREVAPEERRVEHVLVGVVEAGAYERVAEVAHGRALWHDVGQVLRRGDRTDGVAPDHEGGADVRAPLPQEDVV